MLKNIMSKLIPQSDPPPNGVLGVFQYLDNFTHALENIRNVPEIEKFEAFSPTSYHEIEHASGFGASPVRWVTLVCGLIGTLTGFFLCYLVDLDWPLVVGNKTPGIYSLPAFIVVMFELTILFGGLGTILAMLWFCKIPNIKVNILDSRFTDDRFGIYIPNAGANSPAAKLLKDWGAEEVRELKP